MHEIKKTKAIEEAGIWQVKYYMYYLQKRGVKNITAKIDFPLLKETKEIFLEDSDIIELDKIIKNIENLVTKDRPPEIIEDKICKKCSYYDLCYI